MTPIGLRIGLSGIALLAFCAHSPATEASGARKVSCLDAYRLARPLAPNAIPALYWVGPHKDQYETTDAFRKRVQSARKAFDDKGAAALGGKYFHHAETVYTSYDADRQRLSLRTYISGRTIEVADQKYQGFTIETADGDTRHEASRVGNAVLGVDVHGESRRYFGLAVLGAVKHPLLRGATVNLKVPPDKARELEHLKLVVVGETASPWVADSSSSGETYYAPQSGGGKGALYTSRSSSNLLVVKPICAAVFSDDFEVVVPVLP